MVRGSRLWSWLFVALVLFYLYAPILVIVVFSFTTSPRLSLPIEGLTLDWYGRAFADPLIPMALKNSAILATISAVGGGIAGAAFAFGLVTLRSPRLRASLLSISMLPAIVPLLVIGIALAVFFRTIALPQGLIGAAIGHVLVSLPFVILTMNARLESFDFSILEAARDLGATRFQAFRDITLPLIRPSVVGAALLAAALSLDEFVVTWFNIGSQQTVPTLVWGLMRRGIDPSINAIATLLLALLVCLVVASNLLNRRKS
ncbi:MAG: ABC transporter permease [Devosia sp.]|uniref:ABC transporter permease n=1 Tax=Devosia sp. TaxID=1871048 RepID=UPI001A454A55|nr:ABC transporter permease [Devosia sp.]MBL8597960.1 ABC transporter permease [Devosia sp.]